MMFVDACAIVSIMSQEDSAQSYQLALDDADETITSALAAWEAVLVLSRIDKYNCSFNESKNFVLRWLASQQIKLISAHSPGDILAKAVDVAEKHGVGKRGLSSMDCFHYAYAKQIGAPLLTLDQALRNTDITCLP
jgi:ribonuclease VapC